MNTVSSELHNYLNWRWGDNHTWQSETSERRSQLLSFHTGKTSKYYLNETMCLCHFSRDSRESPQGVPVKNTFVNDVKQDHSQVIEVIDPSSAPINNLCSIFMFIHFYVCFFYYFKNCYKSQSFSKSIFPFSIFLLYSSFFLA